MSRSNYHDDGDNWDLIRWRGAVKSALRGRRGQALLHDLATALDALPEKKLVDGFVRCEDGVCALGAVAQYRGVDVSDFEDQDPDYFDSESLAGRLDIADALCREVMYVNDDDWCPMTPEARWRKVRDWVERQLK